ncbi:GNAT family N-acetyltransferase [Bacillus lacus]|uniref:GNAT family N-acetyltransferase n=1 Tax=Metabacillus lacus TaxID=1983721 RepID=A0A7X2IYC7_9BACI|nr:GNAT family N-acetyltransferase [Metabacillus lacus]MRX71935.1 GNAT family N-acetyltransferase [Metabacillus lacus]
MTSITFSNIYKEGKKIEDSALFIHVHNQEMLLQYDSNFIVFKSMPSSEEFLRAYSYLRNFHEKYNQKHVRFYFPENMELPPNLQKLFKYEDFTVGILELYHIDPDTFSVPEGNPDITVEAVTVQTLQDYLALQYDFTKEYGEEFALRKQEKLIADFYAAHKQQVIAYYRGAPAGSVDVILSNTTAEIDGLGVKEQFQKKGIGTALQHWVMKQYADQTVILVANGEDTPRDMYRKQGYQYGGFQYELLKVYE